VTEGTDDEIYPGQLMLDIGTEVGILVGRQQGEHPLAGANRLGVPFGERVREVPVGRVAQVLEGQDGHAADAGGVGGAAEVAGALGEQHAEPEGKTADQRDR